MATKIEKMWKEGDAYYASAESVAFLVEGFSPFLAVTGEFVDGEPCFVGFPEDRGAKARAKAGEMQVFVPSPLQLRLVKEAIDRWGMHSAGGLGEAVADYDQITPENIGRVLGSHLGRVGVPMFRVAIALHRKSVMD